MDDGMDDQMDDQIQPGETEVARRLGAYAEARLTPTDEAVGRMRASVTAAPRATSEGATQRAAAPIARSRWRRPVAVILAACLTVAVLLGGAAVSTRPGAPLYGAGLWMEGATLPAQLVARAQSEIERLERRIEEARFAAAAGDAGAATASLVAYSTIVTETGAEVADDASARVAVVAALGRHLPILLGLVDAVPDDAEDAATAAFESCTMTLDALDRS
jgi:hypothetical protein